jgi:hypothetical protein
MTCYKVADNLGLKQNPIWWSNCNCNQEISLRCRYFKESQKLNLDTDLIKQLVNKLASRFLAHTDGVKIKPISVKEFLSDYGGSKRNRYEKAAHDLYNNLPTNKIEMFIKDEFYWEEKPPRGIFARDYAFNILFGRYTKPIEHIFSSFDEVLKGKNYSQRGEIFKNKYITKYLLENDYSKFESSQRPEVLKLIELELYKQIIDPQYLHEFLKIFEYKLRKPIKTMQGISAYLYGCRGSGDMDTGLGNTIVNYIACQYFLIKNNLANELNNNFIIDGDDSVLFVNNKDLKNYFSDLGFEAKLVVHESHLDTSFCSGKFLKINEVDYYFFPDAKKTVDTLCFYRPSTKFNLTSYYYTLGIMYSKIFANMPVYKEFVDSLMSLRYLKNTNFIKNSDEFKFFDAFHAQESINQKQVNSVILESQFISAFGMNKMPILQFRNINNLNIGKVSNRPTKVAIKYKEIYENLNHSYLYL